MSDKPENVGPSSSFESRDCVDIFFDGPGDSTVRPLRPALLRLALAERERLARYRASDNKTGAQPSDEN